MPLTYPYDIQALEALGGSHEVAWPLHKHIVGQLNVSMHRELCEMISVPRDEEQSRLLMIAAPAIQITALTLGLSWLTAMVAKHKSFDFSCGTAPIMDKHTFSCPEKLYQLATARFSSALAGHWLHPARRTAHQILTNHGLAWGRQKITILSHNKLLQATARADNLNGFRYETADRLYTNGAIDWQDIQVTETCHDLTAILANKLGNIVVELCDADAAPIALINSFKTATASWLAIVSKIYSRVRRNHLPQEIWTGTGGNLITRTIRAAVQADGGRVVGFEHGGSAHIHHDLGLFNLFEVAFCDQFIADTPQKAAIFQQGVDRDSIIKHTPIVGSTLHETSFSWLRPNQNPRPGTSQWVMYVTTAFVGEMQYPLQPLLPDVIYANWQGRLLDGLALQNLKMMCKQHPEGLRKGEPFKTSSTAEYVTGKFSETHGLADAFIFDYPATTALWEAMCTNKPIVFIDLGLTKWHPDVWEKFKKRCSVVTASFDNSNRPVVDFDEVASALAHPPMDDDFAEAYLTGCPR